MIVVLCVGFFASGRVVVGLRTGRVIVVRGNGLAVCCSTFLETTLFTASSLTVFSVTVRVRDCGEIVPGTCDETVTMRGVSARRVLVLKVSLLSNGRRLLGKSA